MIYFLFQVDGHDSKEDAESCIQLMLWKIGEELKLKKPSSVSYSSGGPNIHPAHHYQQHHYHNTSNTHHLSHNLPHTQNVIQQQQLKAQKPAPNSIYKLNNLSHKVEKGGAAAAANASAIKLIDAKAPTPLNSQSTTASSTSSNNKPSSTKLIKNNSNEQPKQKISI